MRSRLSQVAVISVVCCGLVLACWMLFDARRSAWDAAAKNGANLAQTLGLDLEHTIETFDVSLQATQDGLRLPELLQLPLDARRAVLFSHAGTGRYFGDVMITDARGTVALTSFARLPQGINLSDRDVFRAQRNSVENQLFVGMPFLDPFTGQQSIGLSRRIAAPSGGFAGIVTASLQLSYLRELLGHVRLGDGDASLVLSADGILLMRDPSSARDQGRALNGTALFGHIGPEPSGVFTETSPIDGVRRLYAWHRTGTLPFVVLAGQSLDGVFQEWRQRALVATLVGLPLLAAALLLGRTLAQELERRAQAEAQAFARGAAFEAIFDQSADGLFLLRASPAGGFVLERANPALSRLWGLPALAMEGRDPRGFLAPGMVAEMERHWRTCLADGTAARYGTRQDQGDAAPDLETVVVPVHEDQDAPGADAAGPNGARSLLLGSVRDVSEQAEMARRLHQAQKLEAVCQVSVGVTHDFNNLLQALMVGLRQAVAELPDTDRRRQVQATIHAVNRGIAVTKRLLALTRNESGSPRLLDVGALVGGMSELLGWAVGSGVKVQTVMGAALWPVVADAARLQMGLLNLAVNARDAMPGGGRLMLRIRNVLAREASQNGMPHADHVLVVVHDTGTGMDQATLACVFDAFFTTKASGRGTGLGLWMVREFLRASGGDVRVRSEPGQGTQILLWFPRGTGEVPPDPPSDDPAAASRDAPSGPAPAANLTLPEPAAIRRSGRILLVDDDAMVLAALARLLNEAGFRVVAAADAAEAMRALADADGFALLVADQNLPGMSGLALVAAIAPDHPGLPVLLMTGSSHLDAPPGVRVLQKPIDADVLLAELAAAMGPPAA